MQPILLAYNLLNSVINNNYIKFMINNLSHNNSKNIILIKYFELIMIIL